MSDDIQPHGLEPDEDLQLYVDDRLSPEKRSEVEKRLAHDPRARQVVAALSSLKRGLRESAGGHDAPFELRSEILQAIELEDERRGRRRSIWWLAAAAAVLLTVLATLDWESGPKPLDPQLVAQDFAGFAAGQLPLDLVTEDVEALQRFLDQRVPFHTRVFDLAMMDYGLVGGRVHRLGGRPSALFIYRSSSGRLSICQMVRGSLRELPQEGRSQLRRNEGIEFIVYAQPGGLTMVYWQEGDLVCVMTSDADSEETVQLAFAKAEKV